MATTYTRVIENVVLNDTLELFGHQWDNTLIRNVTIKNVTGDGITLKDVDNVRIENCTIANVSATGIRLAQAGSTSDVTIVGNNISTTGKNGISAGQFIDQGIDQKHLQIIGNRIDNTGLAGGPTEPDHHGMYIQATDFLIEDNYITRSVDGNGISVRSTGIVRDNLVDGSGKSGIAYYADHLPGASDTLIIENNVVVDSAKLETNRNDIDLLTIPIDSYAAHNFIVRNNVMTDSVGIGSDYTSLGIKPQISSNTIVSDTVARQTIQTRLADVGTTEPAPTPEPTPTPTPTPEPTPTPGGQVLTGTAGDDNLTGGSGNDSLSGADGKDVLDGRGGNDVLKGGAGGDTFVITAGNGSDTVTDFVTTYSDVVRLVNYGIKSFTELKPLLTQSGADTIVKMANGETLTMKNVFVSSLTADEFQFVNPSTTPTAPTTGTSTVVVNALGTPAGGVNAHFNLLIDGKKVGEGVAGTTAKDYAFTTSVTADAAHKVQVQFDNDATISGQDRNLIVNKITINGKAVAPTAPIVTYDKGALDGKDVIAGQSGMWWNGTLVVNADKTYFPAVKAAAAAGDLLDVYNHLSVQQAAPSDPSLHTAEVNAASVEHAVFSVPHVDPDHHHSMNDTSTLA